MIQHPLLEDSSSVYDDDKRDKRSQQIRIYGPENL